MTGVRGDGFAGAAARCRRGDAHRHRARAPLGDARAVLHLAGELAAGRVDVVAARLAHRGDDAAVVQHGGEGGDARARASASARMPGTG